MNCKGIILITILSLFVLFGHSQKRVKIKKDDFITEKEGGKDAWRSVREGLGYYKKGKARYPEALEKLLLANRYNNELPELNYLVGVNYLFTFEKNKAAEYLEKAYKMKPDVAKDIIILLARAYHCNTQFNEAIKFFKVFRDSIGAKKLKRFNFDVNRAIEQCENGLTVTPTDNVKIVNLGDKVNSEYADYSPVISPDGRKMYFTSRRPGKFNKKRNKLDGFYFEDIYVSLKIKGVWNIANYEGKRINTKHNNAVIGISPNGNRLFLYDGRKNGGDILYSDLKKEKWSGTKSMSSKINSEFRESSICMTPGGDTVFFVSERTKPSVGGKDIFMAVRKKKNNWGKPVILSEEINTPYNEEGVSLSSDGKTLFFSSKGHNSIGGYDVFKATINASGNWSKPENLGIPINTTGDDMFFTMMANGKIAYYASIHEDCFGDKDIYKVMFADEEGYLIEEVEEEEESESEGEEEGESEDDVSDVSKFTEKVKITITGNLSDQNGSPVEANIVISNMETKDEVKVVSDENGDYSSDIISEFNYIIRIYAEGYSPKSEQINTKGIIDKQISKNYVLDRVK